MSERDDERRLRSAFARLREEEAQRAPSLAQVVARAEAARGERSPRRPWLRLALPLGGAAAAGVAWWIATSAARAPSPDPLAMDRTPAAARDATGGATAPDATREPPIALGSLRSPTDVLLAPPLPPLSADFSRSLIPAPPESAPPKGDQTRRSPARRFPA